MMKKPNFTHIVALLDRSGSMEGLTAATTTGYQHSCRRRCWEAQNACGAGVRRGECLTTG